MQSAEVIAESQWVIFRLGTEEFAVPIQRVLEILRPQKVTRMPRSPWWMAGVTNLRGRVVPVADLRTRLRLELAPHDTHATRVMVVDAAGDQLGLRVDAVVEVLRAPEERVEAPSAVLETSAGEALAGVVNLGERMILLLDLDRLFAVGEQGGTHA